MRSDEDAPLLPGDRGQVEQQRERVRQERAREELAERVLALAAQRSQLPQDFGDWLRAGEYEPDDVADAVRTIAQLLRLKAEVLDSPDPLEWTEELMTPLVMEVFPRELPEGLGHPRHAAATLLLFVEFLDSTRQWRERSFRSAIATVLLARVAWPDLEDWGPGVEVGEREAGG